MRSLIRLDLESLQDSLTQQVTQFTAALLNDLERAGLAAELGTIDHICYRVANLDRYERFKHAFEGLGSVLSEAYINGRPIAAIKLDRAIQVDATHSVDVVELPAPRGDTAYEEGFEHIEVVISGGLDGFMARYAALNFNCSNLQASSNRDISKQFPSGLVKFHEASLEALIRREQQDLADRVERRVVVLDFDDTLVNSKKPFLRACQAALAEFLQRPIPFDEISAKARPTFPEFFGNFGIHAETAVHEAVAVFQRHWPRFVGECSLPVGIHSLLSCLRTEGVELHVWTARDRATTLDYLKQAGLDQMISAVHGYNSDGPGKPHPPQELQAMDGRAHLVMIGDSSSDQAAAANLRAFFLQAAWVHSANLDVNAEAVCTAPLVALTKSLAYFDSNDSRTG